MPKAVVTAIRDRLEGYSALSAIVGTKIYPVVAPQKAKAPLVVYEYQSSFQSNTMGEASTASDLREGRMTFDCVSTRHEQAHDIADQVNAALDRWGNGSSVRFVHVTAIGEGYLSETEEYRVQLEIRIWHE